PTLTMTRVNLVRRVRIDRIRRRNADLRNRRPELVVDRVDEDVGDDGIAGVRRMNAVEGEEPAGERAVAAFGRIDGDALLDDLLEGGADVDQRRAGCARGRGDRGVIGV